MDIPDSWEFPPWWYATSLIEKPSASVEEKTQRKNLEALWISEVDGEVVYFGRKFTSIVQEHWAPLKIFAPQIAKKRIGEMQQLFQDALEWFSYKWKYVYTYCTKSNHFAFIVREILKDGQEWITNHSVHLETSSAFDAKIIDNTSLHPDSFVIHNGFKSPAYLEAIGKISGDYKNAICVLDGIDELEKLKWYVAPWYTVWIRLSTEDGAYNSRFGIPLSKVEDFVRANRVNGTFSPSELQLKMIHFFIETGIKDAAEYYILLKKYVEMYCRLYMICPSLQYLNIGWWMPVNYDLSEEISYRNIVETIVGIIQEVCDENGVPHPDIFTEFWSYTVADTWVTVMEVIWEKNQNGDEKWYIVDGSPMSMIPDSWALDQYYPTLALNHWDASHQDVSVWWITCDKDDTLLGKNGKKLSLPTLQDTPLLLGVLKTWAYQENIGGFWIGSLTHCQNSRYKVLVILENGETKTFFDAQDEDARLETLGYLKRKRETV